MNTAHLKAYAPKARTDFIAAVTKRAEKYGVTAKAIHSVEVTGDVCLVNGNPYPAEMASRINRLAERVKRLGFEQTMEQMAYLWFNRLIAIRYMELHDYLGHGRRVLSHPEHPTGYQVLEECTDITYGEGGQLPHLSHEKVVELKLDGTQDEELYRELLLAQCHALHQAMPFLFETIDDETELLLPENLTKTDSLIKELVSTIPEEDWANIEIIGWLYQFYISEKKDEVIGKVVKSEDIPAATQLFTPNWIVKYMVQNSLGAQWLATYPQSPLKGQMEYYIEPAEQTDEVNAQLAAITPEALNPEELTLIDPASGSGHILVEAYELFKAIYLERGYRQRDVPQLILEKNLFGLDIDERAAQLTGFALMMKGRADDRRLFERGVKLNVMALVDSDGIDVDALAKAMEPGKRIELVPSSDLLPETIPQMSLSSESDAPTADASVADVRELVRLFEHATTFGSLIQVPEGLAAKLPALKQLSETTSQDLFVSEALKRLTPLVQQAELLAAQYVAVVANPPYMGSNPGMNPTLKLWVGKWFPDAKSDLFACFIERCSLLAREHAVYSMVTMHAWMFSASFETLRERLLQSGAITTLAHLGPRAFGTISGEIVQTAAFAIRNSTPFGNKPVFFRLIDGGEQDKAEALRHRRNRFAHLAQEEFYAIPTTPVAYWASNGVFSAFEAGKPLRDVACPRVGLQTNDNPRFIRSWFEVKWAKVGLGHDADSARTCAKKWFPYDKGGEYRKWYGNNQCVLNWAGDGREIVGLAEKLYKSASRTVKNREYYFQPGVTYTNIGSSKFGARFTGPGWISDQAGSKCFASAKDDLLNVIAVLHTPVAHVILRILCPNHRFDAGSLAGFPMVALARGAETVLDTAERLIELSTTDWDAYERSWDFQSLPLLTASTDPTPTLESSYTAWITQNKGTIAEMKRLEEENNCLFIDAYGLADELTPDVPIEQITLTVNPAYRYGGKLSQEEQWTRFRQDTMEELVSYAIGCMMGRYSLDAPGLIYAHSAGEGFDTLLSEGQYTAFPADDDGIVPLTDTEWFEDDACNRLVEFLSKASPAEHLEANLSFLAENLSPKKGESSRDTLRRYLSDKFYKDHLQTYKKRPIYWLFSSGKEKAFQCLVYLHRYNEGTLARMRTEYVIPLTAKLSSHIDKLENDKSASGSAAEIKKLEKEIKHLQKQQTELTEFDEKLKHFADKRIKLDLDDGVKVNYGKFSDLLAEVKSIHGKKV